MNPAVQKGLTHLAGDVLPFQREQVNGIDRPTLLAQEILDACGVEICGPLKRSEHGVQNVVFFVPSKEQNYYLKIAKIDEVGNRHASSRSALGIVKALGIPGPELLFCDTMNDAAGTGYSYTLQTEIPGENLQDLRLQNTELESQIEIFAQVGEALADLHDVSGRGLNQSSLKGTAFGHCRRRDEHLDKYLAGPKPFSGLVDCEQMLREAFQSIREAPFFCLVHGDAKPDNAVVSNGEVVFVDWESARISAPEYDLAMFQLLFPGNQLAFHSLAEGYREIRAEIDLQRLSSCKISIAFERFLRFSETGDQERALEYLGIIQEEHCYLNG